MIISILNDSILLRKESPEKLREYFETVNVTIFSDIFGKMSPIEAQQTVLFILCGYSEDSPLLILRQDTKEEKMGICEFLQIPEMMRPDLINLKDPDARRATTTYVTQFAGPIYRSLFFMRIQLNDFELAITNREYGVSESKTDKDGVTTTTNIYDVKEHGKAIAEHARLCQNIDKVEKQIRDQVKRMDGIEEMRNFLDKEKKAGKITGGRRGNIESCITA